MGCRRNGDSGSLLEGETVRVGKEVVAMAEVVKEVMVEEVMEVAEKARVAVRELKKQSW